MRRLIAVRHRYRALGAGALTRLYPGNRKVLAHLRSVEGETILCAANMAWSVQSVQLDRSACNGRIPAEVFDPSPLPPIGTVACLLTLPGDGFYWLLLAEEAALPDWYEPSVTPMPEFQTIVATSGIRTLVASAQARSGLARALHDFLPNQRWFGGKGRSIAAVEVGDWAILSGPAGEFAILLLDVAFAEGATQRYLLPLATAWETKEADRLPSLLPFTLAHVRQGPRIGALHDALGTEDFAREIVAAIRSGARIGLHGGGVIVLEGTSALAGREVADDIPIERFGKEQSNTSIRIGEDMVLKVLRRIEAGVHPEVEIGTFLTEVAHYANTPATLGSIRIEGEHGEVSALAILQAFVRNQGDAWSFTTDYLERFVREVDRRLMAPGAADEGENHDLYKALVRTLGRRVAELHSAFALPTEDPAFRAEPVTGVDVDRWLAAIDAVAARARVACQQVAQGGGAAAAMAADVLAVWPRVACALTQPPSIPAGLMKTRHHGDLHLGQVVVVGEDFHILDFEGEPLRPLAERRAKHCPLRDVAGMVRSLDYARFAALRQAKALELGGGPVEDALAHWSAVARNAFLVGYREAVAGCPSIPQDPVAFSALSRLFLLEKVLYEICYEAANRPDWLPVPLQGLLALLASAHSEPASPTPDPSE